jgi:tetratricopeptide (TPR) repeat protein
MSFKDKLKGLATTITSTLGVTSNKIDIMIKAFTQYLNTELKVAKDSMDSIAALNSYSESEASTLGAAIKALGSTFERIEKARQEKVEQLKQKYVNPLNELLQDLNKLNLQLKEADKAKKELEKAEKNLEKVKAKPKEKLKGDEIGKAETAFNEAKAKSEKEAAESEEAIGVFNKKKVETIQTITQNLTAVEKSFHEKVLSILGAVKEKVKAATT